MTPIDLTAARESAARRLESLALKMERQGKLARAEGLRRNAEFLRNEVK